MKIKLTLIFSIAYCFAFCSSVFSQTTIYFPSFESINVDKGNVYVAALIFKKYTDKNPKYQLVLADGFSKETPYISVDTRKQAKEKQTIYYMESTMVAIGNVLTINMKMYNTASGKLVWSDAMKLDALEDLEIVLKLFAKAIGTKKPAASGKRDIFSITNYEARELNKKGSNQSYGGALLVGAMTDGGGTYSGLAVLYSFDTRKIILDIKYEYLSSKNMSSHRFGGTIIRPVKIEDDNSPFLGIGAAYGFTSVINQHAQRSDDEYVYRYSSDFERGQGIDLEGCFGYLIGRTSSVSFRLGLYPFITLYSVGKKGSVAGIKAGITATF